MIEVTAALIRSGNRILIARRPSQDELAGLWEFPGGKLEDGESPEVCLAREIREELAITITVGRFFADTIYEYPGKVVHLIAYWAEWTDGEIQFYVHDGIAWPLVTELSEYSFAPADRPIVEKLVRNAEGETTSPFFCVPVGLEEICKKNYKN